jgi:hypothetical protein
MIVRKKIASINYTRPVPEAEQIADPLTAEEITAMKTRIKQWLDNNDTKTFTVTDVVQRVKSALRKLAPERLIAPSQIRAVIDELLNDEEIKEIKEGN